eukprot:scaffold280308_cov162-Cyclotella_meneghiniana.AAC.1
MTCYPKVKKVLVKSTTSDFELYTIEVIDRVDGFDNAINQITSFTSGAEDASNPSANAVDGSDYTYARTNGGSAATFEVILPGSGIDILEIVLKLRNTFLYNGSVEILDSFGSTIESR